MRNDEIDIWFDFANPPHVNLFRPMLEHFQKNGRICFCTAKHFAETIGLLNKYGIEYHLFGRHAGKARHKKLLALLSRNVDLFFKIPNYKVCICSSFEAVQISWLKRKTSIMFDDNEIAPNWLYSKFVSYVITPSAIDKHQFIRKGIPESKILQYNGFKEDVYLADYVPDPNFTEKLPFEQFITVRPENIFASYVSKNARSITKELIAALLNEGYKILYLPRYKIDFAYVDQNHPNVFIPDAPLNGLDVCFYSRAVLTGAGTFAREAALLGTPAVSFFAGDQLLSVDKALIAVKKIFYSRDVSEILFHLKNIQKHDFDQMQSRAVKQQVFSLIEDLLNGK
ncbi:MAG: DUF354 domain-containing protein [Chloroflexi bacterium]|nr:DUF354 domain-containing protein [Chloroflexota bacterium]